jgi:nicotinamidase-related amidase
MKNIELLVIDPQYDFCAMHGSLYVPGADKDMERLGDFINREQKKIYNITITLDTHSKMQIFHPRWWVDKKGNNPKPFTIITVKDINDGIWTTSVPEHLDKSFQVLKELEYLGRFSLCIWPEHCINNSVGATIYAPVYLSVDSWSNLHKKDAKLIHKGQNQFTEAYSAVNAEVQMPDDFRTQTNFRLINKLKYSDHLVVAGQASSHCVYWTVKDIVDQHNYNDVKKLIILKDCMSPVKGFEKNQEDLFKEMKSRGATIINSTELTL